MNKLHLNIEYLLTCSDVPPLGRCWSQKGSNQLGGSFKFLVRLASPAHAPKATLSQVWVWCFHSVCAARRGRSKVQILGNDALVAIPAYWCWRAVPPNPYLGTTQTASIHTELPQNFSTVPIKRDIIIDKVKCISSIAFRHFLAKVLASNSRRLIFYL